MKKRKFIVECRDMTTADLKAKVLSLSEELMKLRFRHAVSQLDQTHQFSELKTNIAQAKTVLHQKLQLEKQEAA